MVGCGVTAVRFGPVVSPVGAGALKLPILTALVYVEDIVFIRVAVILEELLAMDDASVDVKLGLEAFNPVAT